MCDCDVIIVGAGPAGSAAAVRLLTRRPGLAGGVVIMDKAVFPRPKLCGGGITRATESALASLGLPVPSAAVPVTSVEFRFPTRTFTVRAGRLWPNQIFKVVCREAFDHALLRRARALGAVIKDGEGVTDVSVAADSATVFSNERQYRTRVVIAADGANSLVRRQLELDGSKRLGVASELRIRMPAPDCGMPSLDGHALFDFRVAPAGRQGYYWEFPTPSCGERMMSVGVADAQIFGRLGTQSVTTELREIQARIGRPSQEVRGAPMRWFDPSARQSLNRVLFIGDAAGTEPLFDEGISTALEFGILAADATVRAIDESEFSFSRYESELRRTALGRSLGAKLALARRFYAAPDRWAYIPLAWPARRLARTRAALSR